MNDVLFEIVHKMTQQRDSDSLQRALLIGLMDVLPLHEAALYRPVGEGSVMHMEQLLEVKRSPDEGATGNSCEVIDNIIELSLATYVNKCMEQAELLVDEEPSIYRMLIPLTIDHKIKMVLSLNGEKQVSKSHDFIKNVIKIYENFSAVLDGSERDKLTGLFNRRTFDAKLKRMLKAQKTRQHKYIPDQKKSDERNLSPNASAWLVILDVDFFKRVNDRFGHIVGDEILLEIAQRMTDCFRRADYLFRFGGEEFVIILEPISCEMAKNVLERFRKTIADYKFPLIGEITVSLGFARITENDFPVTILSRADEALYYAKEHGRNCVYNYEQLIDEGKLEKTVVKGSVDIF